jgi:hypothetical protein
MKHVTTRDIEHYNPRCNARGTIPAGTEVRYAKMGDWAAWVLTSRPDWMSDWDFQHSYVDVPADAVQRTLSIGDRVDTHSHGLGEIVNQERANAGWPDRPNMVLTGRFGVLLDDAAKYPMYKDGIAYFLPKELK